MPRSFKDIRNELEQLPDSRLRVIAKGRGTRGRAARQLLAFGMLGRAINRYEKNPTKRNFNLMKLARRNPHLRG